MAVGDRAFVSCVCDSSGGRLMHWSLLGALVICAGCSNMQVKTSSDSDWVSDHKLYDGDKKKLFVDSEFGGKQGDEPPTKAQLITDGDDAWGSGDIEKALFDYLRALKLDDQDKTLYFKIGAIHEYRGNVRLAELAYSKAIELDPSFGPAIERQGTMLLKQRKYEAAKRAFLLAIELDEQRLIEQATKGEASASPQQVVGTTALDEQARSLVEEASGATRRYDHSSPFQAYNGLGIIYDMERSHSMAIEVYDVARRIAPRAASVYNNMGYSYYLADQMALADQYFRKAIALNSEYIAAWRNLALVNVRKGRYQEAIDILASRVDEEASAYNTVGYLCMLDGRYELAEQYFNRAIELSPVYFKAANENLKRNRELRSKGSIASAALP